MLLTKRIKLEVSDQDAATLEFMQSRSRGLYKPVDHAPAFRGEMAGMGSRQADPLWKWTYRCAECGLAKDRDENSAINILARFLARPEPHTGDPVRCADVFTATTMCCM